MKEARGGGRANGRLVPAVEFLRAQRLRMMMMMKLAEATANVDVYIVASNNAGGGGRGGDSAAAGAGAAAAGRAADHLADLGGGGRVDEPAGHGGDQLAEGFGVFAVFAGEGFQVQAFAGDEAGGDLFEQAAELGVEGGGLVVPKRGQAPRHVALS